MNLHTASRTLALLCGFCLALHAWAAAPFKGIPDPPQLPVRAFLLLDYASGKVLAESEADQRVEPASLTKVLTVYTVADALAKGLITLQDEPVISEYAWKQEGSRMFIEVGRKVSVDALLHGDIIQSGNDASVALAEHVSGSEDVFVTVMNGHAERLGMKASHFANSTGLPHPETYTTARDMAALARALIRDFPEVYSIFRKPDYTYNGITQRNRNGLLGRDPSVDGIKTGHTEAAGYCLIASALRDGMRLISVVMGAESDAARAQASQALLNYGFRFFENRTIHASGDKVARVRVWKGAAEEVDIGVHDALTVTVPRATGKGKLEVRTQLREPLIAPLKKGEPVGELIVSLRGTELARAPLVTREPVAAGSLIVQGLDTLWLLFE